MSDDVTVDSFTIPQGDDWQRTYPVFEDDAQTVPQDLTGYSARCQIRKRPGAALIHEFSTTAGTISIDGPAGKVSLLLDRADSAAWTWRNAQFDIVLTSPASPGPAQAQHIVRGSVFLEPSVTA